MKLFFRYFGAWIASIIVCVATASLLSTQRVLSALIDAGGTVSFGERVSMTLYDMIHFGSLYAIFVTLAFLIAFGAGLVLFHFAKIGRPIVFIVAGAVAMFVMLQLMQIVFFGVPIVAGARDGFGILLQMAAGGLGGYVFHQLSQKRESKPSVAASTD